MSELSRKPPPPPDLPLNNCIFTILPSRYCFLGYVNTGQRFRESFDKNREIGKMEVGFGGEPARGEWGFRTLMGGWNWDGNEKFYDGR